MAKPRVFVSSTYYELKHIRSSLELFIESLGYEPVLSEKGDIAYLPDRPLDESCYREASSSDIFVLIIGGRYGSEASGSDKRPSRSFFERYESITKKEFETAYAEDIPIYILIEHGVYTEYQTYLRNKENERVKYAHVDSVNVFRLVEEILSKPRNNPLYSFERSAQIETWLRDQWAGLFRELLKTRSQQKQLLALTGQVGELKAVNETLKTYLEAVMKGISKDASTRLIESEEKRLEETRRMEQLKANNWYTYIIRTYNVSDEAFIKIMNQSLSAKDFAKLAAIQSNVHDAEKAIIRTLEHSSAARSDFNDVRKILGIAPINFLELNASDINSHHKLSSPKISGKVTNKPKKKKVAA